MLSQSDSDIIKTLTDMENSSKEIKHDLLKICWYMRGGVSYDEATAMSPQEQSALRKVAKTTGTQSVPNEGIGYRAR